jgi:hypothetical protein
MIKETMTREERILAAINLEPYDRVPVSPLLSPSFPLRHRGKHTADAYNRDLVEEGFQATLDLFDEVGGWDVMASPGAFPVPSSDSSYRYLGYMYVTMMRYPGLDGRLSVDSSPQFAEYEVLKAEDYDEIIKLGWRDFMEKNAERITQGVIPPPEEIRAAQAKAATERYLRYMEVWRERGIPVISGLLTLDPQMALSLLRTLPQFTLDLYRRPEKVTAVLDAWVDDFATNALESIKPTGILPNGIPGIMIACERGSGSYYNL